jgi:hypothetical protein
MSGQVVPLGKSLNAQVGGLILRSGGPGVLAGVYSRSLARQPEILMLCDTAHYTNNKIRSGWVIDEVECNNWMMQVARATADVRHFKGYSQGGYGMVGDLGSIWVDPNAQ